MRTTLDITEILCMHLQDSSLTSAISGVVCKKRPIDSKKEDVVINTLFVDNEEIQNSVANVNVYVSNKTQKFNGVQDNTQPDFGRLKTITDILTNKVNGLLIEQWSDGYTFTVQQVTGPKEDESQHYMNIRVEFKLLNVLN